MDAPDPDHERYPISNNTAMGKSISGDITGIFMESYEEEFILNPKNNKFIPAFWKREVDEVYTVYGSMAKKIFNNFWTL